MKGVSTQEGRQKLEQFKMEAANEVGVNLKQGYNGDLTSRQAGSVGGQMVKKMCPEQQMSFKRCNRRKIGHQEEFKYFVSMGI